MYLLQLNESGSFNLVEHINPIPQYAILSHTWGLAQEEVTHEDIMSGKEEYKSKPGYKKLRFCAEQAKRDGFQYCWVDTCCINKLSSAELTEAINSMFQWYQDASKCYVYLTDVPRGDTKGDSDNLFHLQSEWHQDFQNSRWFTRGWTLQELLAPRSVEFFSRQFVRLGDKVSLQQLIHETTAIPLEALLGKSLSSFSIERRFSWAEARSTTRDEDAIYCLLGIFDVQMPLLYGEKRAKALGRLLSKLVKYEQRQMQILHDAIRLGQAFVVGQLLKEGKDPDLHDDQGYTGLYWAVQYENEPITDMLLSAGANPDTPIPGDMTPFWAAVYRQKYTMVTLIVKQKTLLVTKHLKDSNALFWESYNGDLEKVKGLLEGGVDPNTSKEWVGTPLMLAAINGHAAVVSLLLDNGAEGDNPNLNGRTPLWLAATHGHLGVVDILAKSGANMFTEDQWRETPEFWARRRGYTDVVGYLSR
jgi:ankyrin repeat protein